MTQHFTRNTVFVAFYCNKCERVTQHRIDDGRKGPCLKCMLKLEQIHEDNQKAAKAEAKQGNLFP